MSVNNFPAFIYHLCPATQHFAVPFIVQPVTSDQVPAASHVTVEELIVPSYPTAQDTVDVSPYVVPVVSVYEYPVLDGVPQSLKPKEKYKIISSKYKCILTNVVRQVHFLVLHL